MSTARRPIRAGIIGYGKVGQLRHKLMDESSDWQVVAIADPDIANRELPKGIAGFADHGDLLRVDLDAVFVCTPNHVTADAAVHALEAGKHVFCEKPPGRTREDVARIVAAERSRPGLRLKFGFNHRYHDSVIEAKNVIDSGRMGKVLWMRGVYGKSGGEGFVENWRSHKESAGGGILLDQGIHMLDLFRLFVGDFDEVKSAVGTMYWPIDVEDNAFAILRNGAGQVALLHSSSTQWKHRFTLEIYCSEGYVTIGGFNTSTRSYGRESLVIARNFGGEGYAPGNPREELTHYDRDDSWRREIAEFAGAILHGTPIQMGRSDDAAKVMDLVQRIYDADPAWRGGAARREPSAAALPTFVSAPPSTSRHVIVVDDVREDQIRPHASYDQYIELCALDAARSFDHSAFVHVSCPACGMDDAREQFVKHGFRYVSCGGCASLYANPRPDAAALARWHAESPAASYWRREIFERTLTSRREHVFRPRVQWMLDLLARQPRDRPSVLDAASGYGVLLEELARTNAFSRVVAAEPIRDVASAAPRVGASVLDRPVAELTAKDGPVDAVTSFEVLVRSFSPSDHLAAAARVLRPGGVLCFTTLAIDGFDLQVLWDRSAAIFPPDRLNLLSIEGIKRLAARHGFEIDELSTPGQLDAAIVQHALRHDPSLPVPRFIRTLLSQDDPDALARFQEYLQEYRMSSHARVALRKR